MKIYTFLISNSHLPCFEFSSILIDKCSVWNGTSWSPPPTSNYNYLKIDLQHHYYHNCLNSDHLNFSQPTSGTLILTHSPIVAYLNPEDDEYYYNFSWGMAWYKDTDLNLKTETFSLQDALLNLEVTFLDDPNDILEEPSPPIVNISNNTHLITLGPTTSTSHIFWNSSSNSWVQNSQGSIRI